MSDGFYFGYLLVILGAFILWALTGFPVIATIGVASIIYALREVL